MKRAHIQNKTKKGTLITKLLICMALILMVSLIFVNYIYFIPVKISVTSEQTAGLNKFRYRIKGSNIASQLINQGVIAPKLVLQAALFISRFKGTFKSGLYEIGENATIYQIIEKGILGDTVKGKVTFVEGWPIWKIRQELDKNPDLIHKTSYLNLKALSELLDIGALNPEGIFFPSTYYFEPGTEDLKILIEAKNLMHSNLEKAWSERNKEIALRNPREALILASIIEKETGHSSDRKSISAVFNNRLLNRMKLQTDPTVIYGIGEGFNGNLTIKDLRTDGPYNTYTRYGLPPTPISAPGLASIIAATQPSNSKALYFVGMGDGHSYFSETLKEHTAAVNKYQKKIGQ